MVLMELMYSGCAPAAMIVQKADSLLISGPVLAEVWFGRGVPVVEYPGDDLFLHIRTGDPVSVDGNTGEVKIGRE
jgi:predicted aconitase with swiveling domain